MGQLLRLLALCLAIATLSFLNQAGILHLELHASWPGGLAFLGQAGPRALSGLPPGSAQICFGPSAALPAGSTSLIAVSGNRSDALARALPGWLAVRGLHELVLVDWGSAPPLTRRDLRAADGKVNFGDYSLQLRFASVEGDAEPPIVGAGPDDRRHAAEQRQAAEGSAVLALAPYLLFSA